MYISTIHLNLCQKDSKMKIEQIYTGCLAQGAYYIESNGEVAIIDPLREVQSYIDRAAADQAIGDITITALHTPGHTMESTTYLLKDKNGKDHAIFSGDTLFLGDVGRPDLAQKIGTITKEDLAGYLYDSLRNKIMPLADDVIVYPAHGAGSACGKNMMKETVDTLGNQKLSRVGFDNVIGYLDGGVEAWQSADKEIDTLKSVSAKEFKSVIEKDNSIKIVDVRKASEYESEHVVSALNFPLSKINDHLGELPTQGQFFIHCAGGYRSVIAASILKARGVHNIIDVAGGMKDIRSEKISCTTNACSSKV